MKDILDKFAEQAQKTVSAGYYELADIKGRDKHSLVDSIKGCKGNAVIAEIKPRSPSIGELVTNLDVVKVAQEMVVSGSVGISVLTEPRFFNGTLDNIMKISGLVNKPILMKDFILDSVQVRAAEKIGADAILLIKTLFERGYVENCLDEMINQAHKNGLEVLLETHTLDEFKESLETEADLIGINNRNLQTLEVDLDTTIEMLIEIDEICKPVVSESGITNINDIKYLRSNGVDAFLVGTTLMRARNLGETLEELVFG